MKREATPSAKLVSGRVARVAAPPGKDEQRYLLWSVFRGRAAARGLPCPPPPFDPAATGYVVSPDRTADGGADLGDLYQQMLDGRARRAGGVYYTPEAVADSIARAALGPLVAEARAAKDPIAALLGLRVVDLSCGSGRMLRAAATIIGAALAEVDPRARGAGTWCLAALNCLYGCDLDSAAVDAARYSLWLDFVPVGSAALPELKLEVWDGLARLPAGWGEFDAALGNPPYVSNRAMPPAQRDQLRRDYRTARGQYDLCVPFVEAGLRALRPGGMLGYILSNKFMAADYGAALREMLVEENTILELRDVSSDDLFGGAGIYPAILVARSSRPPADHAVLCTPAGGGTAHKILQRQFAEHPARIITADGAGNGLGAIAAKMLRAAGRLPAGAISCGVANGGFSRRLLTRDEAGTDGAEAGDFKPLLEAHQAGAYLLAYAEESRLMRRAEAGERRWAAFGRQKVLVPGIARRLRASLDEDGHALGRVYYVEPASLGLDAYLLLALLNSDLLDFCYRYYYWPAHLSGGYLRINSSYLATLPLAFPPSAHTEALAARCSELVARLTQGTGTAREVRESLEPAVRHLYGITPVEGREIDTYLGQAKRQ